MGNSLCKDFEGTRPATRKLTVWGDIVNADTRAILSVCLICNLDYDFEQISTLHEEHKRNQEFLAVSPIEDVPVLTEGSYKIISGPVHFMTYLCSTRDLVKNKLYPKDCERKINIHISWFQNKLRPHSGRLIKILMRKSQELRGDLSKETPRGGQRQSFNISPANIEYEVELLLKLLENLDKELTNQKYFGEVLSIADLLYYAEISTL